MDYDHVTKLHRLMFKNNKNIFLGLNSKEIDITQSAFLISNVVSKKLSKIMHICNFT